MRLHLGRTCLALIVSTALGGCLPSFGGRKADRAGGAKSQAVEPKGGKRNTAPPATLKAVDLSDAASPVVLPGPVELAAARNEWTSFVVQVSDRAPNAAYSLRLNGPALAGDAGAIDPAAFEVYQVLSMPVDVNKAGYARHTGLVTARRDLPRALIPLPAQSPGSVDITTLRPGPGEPSAADPADPALLWVDVHVPPDAPAGAFTTTVDVVADGVAVASVPLKLTVYDFALPAERHLQVVGRIRWEDLERLYPERFDDVRPQLMNRDEPSYADAVAVLDSLIDLAHRHRAAAVVPRLHPTVKWPTNAPPEVDWREFDSLAKPWLSGEAFADRIPIGFWPLPAPAFLDRYDRKSQLQYWADAATHFDGNDWLDQSPIWVEKVTPGRATEAESVDLSGSAAETLAVHHRVRAVVPLEADQLHLADNAIGGGTGGAPPAGKLPRVDPDTTTRLYAAAPGLVFAPPMRLWPEGVQRPRHYLRTDMPALVPYVGAGGDERDVRLWAWLAYLRGAGLIHWSTALPSLSDVREAADPNELTWFYPGKWFGLEQPVPTIQLKWLRRAQQDYEYLWLARERGDRNVRVNALLMARLISKPVEIQPGQNPDPAYALMSGTTSQDAWITAQKLLAEMIELHKPAEENAAVDAARKHANEIEMLGWAVPQEHPLLMGRTTQWFIPPAGPDDEGGGPRLNLRFGVDVYNASDVTGVNDLLAWTDAPRGWEVSPQPSPVPVLETYKVQRAVLPATFNPAQVTPGARQPMELTFTNGFRTDRQTKLKVVLPVANSDRREGRGVTIDGMIDEDWQAEDLVQDGPLVKMMNRPGLQKHELQFAERPAKVYTSWAGQFFYVAFELDGISPAALAKAQNAVEYQFRRAWGEDLCEILIQPVLNDGAPGPVLHVVCKPNGSIWVERKSPPGVEPGATPRPWQEVQARIHYFSRPAGEAWRGEVKIPWTAILDVVQQDARAGGAGEGGAGGGADALARRAAAPSDVEPPPLLRFNFVQHRTATGESASWCGQVDFGRDDSLMGDLILRDPRGPGIRNAGNIAGNRSDSATQEP